MQVSVRELKNHLSEYLHRVESGKNIQVERHNVPVARLVPIPYAGRGLEWEKSEGRAIQASHSRQECRRTRIGRSPLILYLDTSALVKAYVEARAAFARLQCEHVLNETEWETLKHEFVTDQDDYLQIGTTHPLLERAGDLAEAFALRAYDSVHLAAAQMLHEDSEKSVVFACYDRKLNQAASLLGLSVLE